MTSITFYIKGEAVMTTRDGLDSGPDEIRGLAAYARMTMVKWNDRYSGFPIELGMTIRERE